MAAVQPLVPRPGLDDIGLLLGDVPRGTPIEIADGTTPAVEDIAAGHKVALHDIPKDAPVHKYGEVIGVALADIPAGAHVHVHNLGVSRWEEPDTYTSSARTQPTGAAPAPARDHFLGYRRADGRAATRNYIVVVPTVNCSATVARMIAQRADAPPRRPAGPGPGVLRRGRCSRLPQVSPPLR